MNRQMWVVAFLAVVLTTATLAAQTSGSSSSQSQSGAITLTGCLQKGSPSGTTGTSGAGSTSGTATSSPSSSAREQFILTNAQMGSSSGSSTSGTSGTSTSGTSGTASSSAASGSRYILDGQESELTKLVGEKVEIKGTLASSSGSGASGGASTSARPEPRRAEPHQRRVPGTARPRAVGQVGCVHLPVVT